MKKIVIITLIIVAAALLFQQWSNSRNKTPITIALVGPLQIANGEAMRQGVELYRDQVNNQGGINGRKLELVFFDDKNELDKAKKIAADIARQNNIHLVIGHYYSSTSAAAGILYKRNEIPAITASAAADSVIANNQWYFRSIPGNALEARFTANYINKSLRQKTASIIYSNDAYGKSIVDNFEKKIRSLGMTLAGKWEWDPDKPADQQTKSIINELAALDDTGIIYFACHATEGVKIVTALKDSGKKYPMLASFAFARSFLAKLEPYPKEQENPGYYSDGIYYILPYMSELGGLDSFIFANRFYQQYGKNPSVVSGCYYDAIQIAVQAVKESGLHGGNEFIRDDRRKIRETLAGFYNKKNAVKGITGLLWFDKVGGVKKHFAVGVWEQQKPMPAFTQFRQQTGKVDNILQEVLNGDIILTEELVMSHTSVAYVDMDILHVSDIDFNQGEFSAEYRIRFRYPAFFDQDPDRDGKVTEPLEFSNAVTPVILGDPVATETIHGITTKTWQIESRFKANFTFPSYPWPDKQKLFIQFRHSSLMNDNLVYVPEVHIKKINIAESGFTIRLIRFFHDMVTKDTTLGDPKHFQKIYQLGYSRFNAEINIQPTYSAYFVFLKLLPLFISTLGLIALFFLPAKWLELRMTIAIIALSLCIFCHLKMTTSLTVAYLTILDYVYFAVYLLIMVSIILILISYHKQKVPLMHKDR